MSSKQQYKGRVIKLIYLLNNSMRAVLKLIYLEERNLCKKMP